MSGFRVTEIGRAEVKENICARTSKEHTGRKKRRMHVLRNDVLFSYFGGAYAL